MFGFKIIDIAKKRAEDAMKSAFGGAPAPAAPTAPAAAGSSNPAPASSAVIDWNAIDRDIELAMEHAGISGVDVRVDDGGFATIAGIVTDEADRDTVLGILEHYPLTGVDLQVQVVAPEPEPADAPAPAAPTDTVVKHVVKAGESWWGMAQRFYGNGKLHAALKAYNKSPRMLHPGHVVEVPPVDRLPKV